MNTQRLTAVMCLCAMSLLSASCGLGQILAPTPTPTSTPTSTPTPTPTATPTETPVPGGIIAGRVYLIDRDELVRTTVSLERGEHLTTVGSTETDENGHYSFLIEEPGKYVVRVYVTDLLDICGNLRTERGWIAGAEYDESGIAEGLCHVNAHVCQDR